MSWAGPLIRFTHAPAIAVSAWRLALSVLFIALVLAVRRAPLPRLGRVDWLLGVVAVAGAAVIGWGDFGRGRDALIGDALALAGALFISGYYVIGRRLRLQLD